MKKVTIKNIDCYGSVKESDYFIVCDEMEEHIIDNWNNSEDRNFENFTEFVTYLLENYSFYGEIQEIIAYFYFYLYIKIIRII